MSSLGPTTCLSSSFGLSHIVLLLLSIHSIEYVDRSFDPKSPSSPKKYMSVFAFRHCLTADLVRVSFFASVILLISFFRS